MFSGISSNDISKNLTTVPSRNLLRNICQTLLQEFPLKFLESLFSNNSIEAYLGIAPGIPTGIPSRIHLQITSGIPAVILSRIFFSGNFPKNSSITFSNNSTGGFPRSFSKKIIFHAFLVLGFHRNFFRYFSKNLFKYN